MSLNQPLRAGSRKRKLADKLATILLIASALIGILIALVSLFEPVLIVVLTVIPPFKLINITALLLFLFSILALAIGLERYATFDDIGEEAKRNHTEVTQLMRQIQNTIEQNGIDISKELTEIEQTLMSTTITVKQLKGYEAVYDEAKRLITACKGSEIIRGTSLGHEENPESRSTFRSYSETLATTIGQRKQRNLGMVFKVVMGIRFNEKGEPLSGYQKAIDKRRELFKENDALDRLEIRYVVSFWSLDLLIVDDEHVMFGFPTVPGDHRVRSGLRVSNKDFVGSVARWYDQYLWSEAKDINLLGGQIHR